MAQASSNAQKEPSMEEILASIRRIIEDSDAAGPADSVDSAEPRAEQVNATDVSEAEMQAAEVAEANQDAETVEADTEPGPDEIGDTAVADNQPDPHADMAVDDGQPAEEQLDDVSDDEVQSFTEEFSDEQAPDIPDGDVHVADDDSSDTPSDSLESTLSLSDIQAEVAGQTDLPDDAETDDEIPEVEPLVRGDEAENDTQHSDVAAAPVVDANSDDDSDRSGSLAALADSITNEAMEEKAVENISSPDLDEPQSLPEETIAGFQGTPIISEQAGRQVAAAFDELSEAYSHPQNKKFDDMAAEMMRPMLQEWLDNNLPVLVERLVREEIDRVARGAAK